MIQILLGIALFTLDKFEVFNTQEEKEKKNTLLMDLQMLASRCNEAWITRAKNKMGKKRKWKGPGFRV